MAQGAGGHRHWGIVKRVPLAYLLRTFPPSVDGLAGLVRFGTGARLKASPPWRGHPAGQNRQAIGLPNRCAQNGTYRRWRLSRPASFRLKRVGHLLRVFPDVFPPHISNLQTPLFSKACQPFATFCIGSVQASWGRASHHRTAITWRCHLLPHRSRCVASGAYCMTFITAWWAAFETSFPGLPLSS